MKHNVLFFALFVLATGCGGGATAGFADGGSQGNFNYEGTSLKPTVTSNGSTIFALTGNITKISYNDLNPTLEETELFIGNYQGGSVYQIEASSPDGSGRRVLCSIPSATEGLRASATYVYFVRYLSSFDLFRVPYAGGTPTLVKNDVRYFAISPSGSTIAYRKASFDGWWKMNSDGTGSTLVTADTQFSYLGGFQSETVATVYHQIYPTSYLADLILPTSGAVLSGRATVNTSFSALAAAGGVNWVQTTDNGTSVLALYRQVGQFPTDGQAWVGSTYFTYMLAGSPDGKRCALRQTGYDLRTISVDSGETTGILPSRAIHSMDWGPFIKNRLFVGTGAGTYSGGAGAALFSESGMVMPSVVFADAVTRASCVLTRVSGDGNLNITFRLDCDNLNKLHYSDKANYALNALVTSASGLKGCFISFDSESGRITSIVTFTKQPQLFRIANGVRLEGEGMEQVFSRGDASREPRQLNVIEL